MTTNPILRVLGMLVAAGAFTLPAAGQSAQEKQPEREPAARVKVDRIHLQDESLTDIIRKIIKEQGIQLPHVEQSVVTVFPLQYVDADEAEDVVEDLFTDAVCTSQGNRLIVKASKADMEKITNLLSELDIDQGEGHVTRILTIKNINAEELADTLRRIVGNDRVEITANDETNVLLLGGPASTVEQITGIVGSLDVARAEQPSRSIKVYKLSQGGATNALTDALQLLLRNGQGDFALDPRTQSVIVSAPTNTFTEIERVLEALDVAPEKGAAADKSGPGYRVRLLWLLSNVEDEDLGLSTPPADLQPVLDELRKLSIDGLQLAAQMVATTTEERFQINAAPSLGDSPVRLDARGDFIRVADGASKIRMQIQARQQGPRPAGTSDLCELECTVAAPVGHYVVLGVTPIETATSVFVLQLLPAGQ